MKKQGFSGVTAAISLFLLLSLLLISLCACKQQNSNVSAGTGGEAADSHAIILLYHAITNQKSAPSNAFITLEAFEEQMRYLYENNYHTLSLTEFLACHEKGKFPENSVMITFDDGYENFKELAYPILKQYQFHAVMFPVVGLTPGLAERMAWNKHLSFHDLRLMDKESGLIDIGSHTYDLHYYRLNGQAAIHLKPDESLAEYKARIKRDFSISKELLEVQTGKSVIALAWPYGVTNRTAVKIAQETGYQLLFTLVREPVRPNTPLNRIPRYVVDSGSMEEFKKILANT